MNRKSFLWGTLALSVACTTLPAFADPMPAKVDQPVTITYYNYNLASAGNGAEATKRMIAEFEAANPNIKVEGIAASPVDITSRIQAAVAAGRVPDVVQMVFSDLDFSVGNLGAVALEDVVPPAELAQHFEGMSHAGLLLGVINGKTYGRSGQAAANLGGGEVGRARNRRQGENRRPRDGNLRADRRRLAVPGRAAFQ